jgi:hypothetical protein
MKRLVTAIAGASLLAAAPVAQAAEAARSTAPMEEANAIGGGSTVPWIVAAVALGIALFLVLDNGDSPDSP